MNSIRFGSTFVDWQPTNIINAIKKKQAESAVVYQTIIAVEEPDATGLCKIPVIVTRNGNTLRFQIDDGNRVQNPYLTAFLQNILDVTLSGMITAGLITSRHSQRMLNSLITKINGAIEATRELQPSKSRPDLRGALDPDMDVVEARVFELDRRTGS